jgi:hypothetical protein
MINEYGAVYGIRIGRGNRSTIRKPALDKILIRFLNYRLIRLCKKSYVKRVRRLTILIFDV